MGPLIAGQRGPQLAQSSEDLESLHRLEHVPVDELEVGIIFKDPELYRCQRSLLEDCLAIESPAAHGGKNRPRL